MLYKNYNLLIILLCLSCAPSSKEQLIEDYSNHYTAIIESNAVDLSNILSAESNSFIEKLHQVDDALFKDVLELGHSYNIPYNTTYYFTQVINSNSTSNDENFIKFLETNSINIFSLYEIYGVSTENTKTAGEYFIAIFRNDKGRSKLDWVKMKKEDGQYKIDLLYMLQHAEHRIMKDYKEDIKSNFEGEVNAYLEDLFNRDGSTLLDDASRDELAQNRRDRFKEEFIIK